MRPTPQGSTELSGSPRRLTDAFLHSLGAAQALSCRPRVLALSLPSSWRNAESRLCASVPVYLRPPCPPASKLREAVSCPCCVPRSEPWLHMADAQEILLGSGCKGARGRVQPPGRQASLASAHSVKMLRGGLSLVQEGPGPGLACSYLSLWSDTFFPFLS